MCIEHETYSFQAFISYPSHLIHNCTLFAFQKLLETIYSLLSALLQVRHIAINIIISLLFQPVKLVSCSFCSTISLFSANCTNRRIVLGLNAPNRLFLLTSESYSLKPISLRPLTGLIGLASNASLRYPEARTTLTSDAVNSAGSKSYPVTTILT